MKIIVLKFGGTSVGSIERIKKAVSIIQRYIEKKYKVIVVSSAMSGVTNDLIRKSQKISKNFESNKVDENLTLVSTGRVPIPGGLNSKVSVFRDLNSLTEHYAIEIGILDLSQPVLTRLHSACFTGDILHSLKCDCGEQLSLTINKIQLEKKGIILYLNQEGRGIG